MLASPAVLCKERDTLDWLDEETDDEMEDITSADEDSIDLHDEIVSKAENSC